MSLASNVWVVPLASDRSTGTMAAPPLAQIEKPHGVALVPGVTAQMSAAYGAAQAAPPVPAPADSATSGEAARVPTGAFRTAAGMSAHVRGPAGGGGGRGRGLGGGGRGSPFRPRRGGGFGAGAHHIAGLVGVGGEGDPG